VSLRLAGVSVTYPGSTEAAVHDVDLCFEAGTHTALLGPNGAGKSTILRALGGLLPCTRGGASLDGRDTRKWPRREFARRVAFVSSAEESAFPVRVRDYVALGRNPYAHGWRSETAIDGEIVQSALARADLEGFEARYVGSLSAGEVQRARIARALAQAPDIMLLDEPTAHLDLGHEFAAFAMLAELVAELSLTVISVTHNINMASRFCGRAVLLAGGRLVADGVPAEVLTPHHLARAFAWPVETIAAPGLGIVAVPVTPGCEP